MAIDRSVEQERDKKWAPSCAGCLAVLLPSPLEGLPSKGDAAQAAKEGVVHLRDTGAAEFLESVRMIGQ